MLFSRVVSQKIVHSNLQFENNKNITYHLRAAPKGCEPKDGAPLLAPPNPPKPLPCGVDDAKEPNPPPCAAAANPLEEPNVPDVPPKDEPPPPNPELAPIPIAAGDPNDGAADGAGAGLDALMPNSDGSMLYFFARLINNCSSLPAYFWRTLSTELTFSGFLLW